MKAKKLLSILTAVILLVPFVMSVSAEKVINDDSSTKQNINLLWDGSVEVSSGTVLTYTINTHKGAYELAMEYKLLSRENLEYEILINGNSPFSGAENLKFHGLWENSTKKRHDGMGNEIAPEQILSDKYNIAVASDNTGRTEEPYLFNLNEENCEITITVMSGNAIIKSIYFAKPQEVAAYTADDFKKNKDAETVVIEGEDASYKSSYDLIPLSDSSSAKVYPSDPIIDRLNYIGGSNWSSSGDTLFWKFHIKTAGYYSFATIYRQNAELGAISYRKLMIDGKVPFEEAKKLKFKYISDWGYYSLGDGKEDYYFWLDQGDHVLSLSVTMGDMSEIYSKMQEVTSVMGDLYIDITMLVGDTVDTYRSYEFFRQIPEYNQRMEYCVSSLNELTDTIEKLQEKTSGSMVSTIDGAIEILNKMLENPYSAHKYKSAYYTAYTNLGSILGSMSKMPLDIDRLFFIPYGGETKSTDVSFIEKFNFGMKRFLKTFSDDYDSVSTSNVSDDALTLWVNWGRDQAQVLTTLINEDFTTQYGIDVNVKVVNATIIQGILAGKGPDVMLHMARTEPINLAMRGALVDLTQFEDFEEVTAWFSSDSTEPYKYKDGIYALPDTESFSMLFVRTDILESLELEIPKTWDEFINVATTLQRNNLQVYVPPTLYQTFLVQSDLPLYDIEKNVTLLTSSEQIKCFIEYTDLFTKYKMPKSITSFFDRFRIGSIPMGIADYTLQTQFEIAAPEIDGRWDVVTVPGKVRNDGTINYLTAASGTGCGITKLSKNPENAWKFLRWWVSSKTQKSYSDNLESLLGSLGRVSTSNSEAFKNLGWDRRRLPALINQKANVVNLPELPGGYYVARGIDQAFWNVVEQNANPNDAMLKWGAIVDSEMLRKKAEYEN